MQADAVTAMRRATVTRTVGPRMSLDAPAAGRVPRWHSGAPLRRTSVRGRMGWWGRHVVPRMVDVSLSQRPVMELRREVCEGLSGRVIEVGFGSGLNLEALPPEVTRVDAVEPSDLAWQRSAARRTDSRLAVNRVGLDGEDLDAADASYDAALVTFSLCTIPDPARALAELRRVLVPGGSLHFLEHGAAPDERVRRWQGRLEPVQRRVAGGCHLTRDPEVLLRGAGFDLDRRARTPTSGRDRPSRSATSAGAGRRRPDRRSHSRRGRCRIHSAWHPVASRRWQELGLLVVGV